MESSTNLSVLARPRSADIMQLQNAAGMALSIDEIVKYPWPAAKDLTSGWLSKNVAIYKEHNFPG